MRKYLRHDDESGELHLVYADLWQGNHEVTEYRVMNRYDDGGSDLRVIRGRPDLDGTVVHGTAPDLWIRTGPMSLQYPVYTEAGARSVPVKTPCPRASNARRKCALCAGSSAS